MSRQTDQRVTGLASEVAVVVVHLPIDAVVDISGPNAGQEQQQLEGDGVRGDEEQRPAVRDRLRGRGGGGGGLVQNSERPTHCRR